MKSLICWLLLVVATPSFSQVDSLTSDHIFDRPALKNLRFPASAQRADKSVRVYVGFTLTKQGRYQDVSVVNQEFIDESIRQELSRFWSNLPNQDPKYAGNYVMPISFMIGKAGSDEVKSLSNEQDKIAKEGNYKVLKELSVVGYIVCELRRPQLEKINIKLGSSAEKWIIRRLEK